MRSIIGKESAARGRDLEVMTLEVVSATGRATLESVVCPREHRAKPTEDCVPCPDGRGPTRDPSDRPGWQSCVAQEGPVAAREGESPADRTSVTAVMTRAVLAFGADLPLADARAVLLESELDAVPVVDREGRPVGIASAAELLRAAVLPGASGARIVDAMQRRVFPVADTARVSDVAALMDTERVDRLPVVAREGRVVGVVTALDLVSWLAAQDDRGARRLP